MKSILLAGSRSFRGLFLWIVGVLIAAAFAEGNDFGEEIIFLAMTLVLLSAVRAVHERHGQKTFLTLAGVTLLGNLGAYATVNWAVDVSALILNLLVFSYISWLIFLKVFSGARVDSDTIFGAVCVYILIGIVCAVGYQLIDLIEPGALALAEPGRIPGEPNVIDSFLRTYVYFSFVTLTSTGFGDIVPVNSVARYLSILEAVTGQIYMSVLVARLVGLHITSARKAE